MNFQYSEKYCSFRAGGIVICTPIAQIQTPLFISLISLQMQW